MMIKIAVKYLQALIETAGNKHIWYYINGVHVESSDEHTNLVSTNGAALGLVHLSKSDDDSIEKFKITIPRESAVNLLKIQKKGEVILKNEGGRWHIGGIEFTPIDGTFPDYRRTLITKTNGKAGHYAPTLLFAFQKAAHFLDGKDASVRVWQNGIELGAVITVSNSPEYVGVVMGIRESHYTSKARGLDELPAWLLAV